MDCFDVNFCFPVKDLENELLRLTPFNPSIYGESFIKASADYPELFDYIPFGPFDSVADLKKSFLDSRVHPDPGIIIFVVFDKKLQSEPTLAGLIGLLNSSAENLCTEVGFIITLPKYQRTHVTTNAIGLLLQYCLEVPERGGLGLRRVQWQASEQNQKSMTAAKKLGFQFEGIQRWQRTLPTGRGKEIGSNGIALREGDPRRLESGRNTAILAMCWDDWENGGRDKVALLMKPRF